MVRRLSTNYQDGLQLWNQSIICKVERAIIVFYYDKIIGDAQVMHLLFIVYSGVMDIWQAEKLSGFSNGHLVGWLFQPTFLYL